MVDGAYPITFADVERTISSSPFAAQIDSIDREAQAAPRGNFLKQGYGVDWVLLDRDNTAQAE